MASPSPTAPSATDPLGIALHRLRLTGALYCRSELTAPWGIGIPSIPGTLSFLAMTAGRAWITVGDSAPVALEPGSLTLVPHGVAHQFTSGPDAPVTALADLDVEAISDRYEVARAGGGGEAAQGLYGVIRFDHVTGQRLVDQLPNLITVDSFDEDAASWLHSTVRFIAREAGELRPGGETIITRLADVLVIQALRHWIERAPEARDGWLAALRDEQLGRALRAVADAPGGAWTVESLAREAQMSRSSFSERFSDFMHQSPMQYVTEWRMQVARQTLEDTADTVATVAARCGYQSEASFSRAFSRAYGHSPGQARRDARALRHQIDEALAIA